MAPSVIIPMDKKNHPMIKTILEYHLSGGSTKYLSNSPSLTNSWYSLGLSSLNLERGSRCVKITVSMGKFSGLIWVWKKCIEKINPVAPQFCGFPMIGGKVGLDQLLMARPTTINDIEFCLVQFRVGYIVLRSMTIGTFGRLYFSLMNLRGKYD